MASLFRKLVTRGRRGNYYAAARRTDNVSVGAMQRVCPGGAHAWFESNVGLIRKPLTN